MLDFHIVQRRFPEARIVETASTGLEYNVNCPMFHRNGGIGKMYINVEDGVGHCHDCGWAGDAIEEFFPLSQNEFEWSVHREEQEWKAMYGQLVKVYDGERLENGVPVPGSTICMRDLPDEHPSWEYLIARGFDTDEIRGFDAGRELYYVDGLTKYGGGVRGVVGRILFQVRTAGSLVGWQARRIELPVDDNSKRVWTGEKWKTVRRNADGEWPDKRSPKYRTSNGMPVSQCLYNLDAAVQYNNVCCGESYAILCEGPLDVLRVGMRGVGSFGAPGLTQKKILDANFDFVVMILDPDINPETNPQKYQKYHSGWGIPAYSLHLPDGKDAGSTSREVIHAHVEAEIRRQKNL